MADDILGHDHLDHGKHLHKGPNAHHGHGKENHGKGHGAHSHGNGQGHNTGQHGKPGHGFHGGHEHPEPAAAHVGVLKKKAPVVGRTAFEKNWRIWLGVGGAILLFGILLYSIYAPLAIALIIIALDTIIEYFKLFTSAIPIDFEILSVGTAYLAGHTFIGPALLIAIIAPPVVELVRGEISEFVGVKIAALLAVCLAAFVLGSTPWQMFIAVVFGLVAQYAGMLMMTGDPFLNAMRRITNAGFSAYIIFIILPGIVHG